MNNDAYYESIDLGNIYRATLTERRRGPGLALRRESEAGHWRQRGQPQPDGACGGLSVALRDGRGGGTPGARGSRGHGGVGLGLARRAQ